MKNKIISQSFSVVRIIFISSLTIFGLYTVQAYVTPTATPSSMIGGTDTYVGAMTVVGLKNTYYSGINFKDKVGGADLNSLVFTNYGVTGFFNNKLPVGTVGSWIWSVDDSGTSYQNGTVYAKDLCVTGTGAKCLSSVPVPGTVCGMSLDIYHSNINGWTHTQSDCNGYDPRVSCPSGYTQVTPDENYAYYGIYFCSKN